MTTKEIGRIQESEGGILIKLVIKLEIESLDKRFSNKTYWN